MRSSPRSARRRSISALSEANSAFRASLAFACCSSAASRSARSFRRLLVLQPQCFHALVAFPEASEIKLGRDNGRGSGGLPVRRGRSELIDVGRDFLQGRLGRCLRLLGSGLLARLLPVADAPAPAAAALWYACSCRAVPGENACLFAVKLLGRYRWSRRRLIAFSPCRVRGRHEQGCGNPVHQRDQIEDLVLIDLAVTVVRPDAVPDPGERMDPVEDVGKARRCQPERVPGLSVGDQQSRESERPKRLIPAVGRGLNLALLDAGQPFRKRGREAHVPPDRAEYLFVVEIVPGEDARTTLGGMRSRRTVNTRSERCWARLASSPRPSRSGFALAARCALSIATRRSWRGPWPRQGRLECRCHGRSRLAHQAVEELRHLTARGRNGPKHVLETAPTPGTSPAEMSGRLRKALDGEGIASPVDVDAATGHVQVTDPQADAASASARRWSSARSTPAPACPSRRSSTAGCRRCAAGARRSAAHARAGVPAPAPSRRRRRPRPPPGTPPWRASRSIARPVEVSVADAEELTPVLPAGRVTASCMDGLAGKSAARRANMTACMKHSCCSSAANHNSEECRAYEKAFPFTCGAG